MSSSSSRKYFLRRKSSSSYSRRQSAQYPRQQAQVQRRPSSKAVFAKLEESEELLGNESTRASWQDCQQHTCHQHSAHQHLSEDENNSSDVSSSRKAVHFHNPIEGQGQTLGNTEVGLELNVITCGNTVQKFPPPPTQDHDNPAYSESPSSSQVRHTCGNRYPASGPRASEPSPQQSRMCSAAGVAPRSPTNAVVCLSTFRSNDVSVSGCSSDHNNCWR